ncbi:class I SAM-dependent methyltransferase [Actinophytocola gossypii]|uniref:Methyltransferase domain-containing protein n=1 Tax=Actinophytocola gossypii TaxID=2812003 RepID=A0ABT2J5I0_9PSEU|nr:class I SAM-dependent methyltransferase [Actinophytocola gossypii]MCT2582519.1 methyltransferase domain-containing protein [Actinophytocola gossypii]
MLDRDVRTYYDRGGERTRLDGTLELLRTKVLLERLLPAPPASVLDVGGAFGVYATWLADRGHRVRLVDPVPLHVDTAAREGVDAVVGDARSLDEPDGGWDAVLLLGPLYHLLDRADRVAAFAEARRVVRPGGVVLAAAISRWASTYEALLTELGTVPGFADLVRAELATGTRRDSVDLPHGFTNAYFHRPDELPGEVADAGLRLSDLYAVEGMAHWIPDQVARLSDPDFRALVLDLIARTEREPATIGATSHLLVAARRP